jgi:hypothetical protein
VPLGRFTNRHTGFVLRGSCPRSPLGHVRSVPGGLSRQIAAFEEQRADFLGPGLKRHRPRRHRPARSSSAMIVAPDSGLHREEAVRQALGEGLRVRRRTPTDAAHRQAAAQRADRDQARREDSSITSLCRDSRFDMPVTISALLNSGSVRHQTKHCATTQDLILIVCTCYLQNGRQA